MTKDSANKMWGGRFTMSPAEIMQEINASIGFDKALPGLHLFKCYSAPRVDL